MAKVTKPIYIAKSTRSAKSRRVFVLYDGSNFYHYLKACNLKHTSRFDFFNFAQDISKQKDLKVSYYVGLIRNYKGTKKENTLRANQQKLFAHLRKLNINIVTGFLLNHDGHYSEKGVDVRIATDLLSGAFKNEYDDAYIISSDTDLIPAMQEARKVGKRVIYVGFRDFQSKALSQNSSRNILLSPEELKMYLST